jgi:hypothetical protein
MLNLGNETVTAPAGASGYTNVGVDPATKRLASVNDAGLRTDYGNYIFSYSTAAQSPAAATRTYITGSAITVPASGLQVGTCFRWTFNLTKTAAGTAASTFDIAFGTTGTTADTARVSFAKPAGTAVVDEGKIVIEAIVRGPISASGVVVGEFTMTHNLQITGHMIIPCANVNTVSAAFDVTAATRVGVCITSGTADAVTIQMCMAEAWNL